MNYIIGKFNNFKKTLCKATTIDVLVINSYEINNDGWFVYSHYNEIGPLKRILFGSDSWQYKIQYDNYIWIRKETRGCFGRGDIISEKIIQQPKCPLPSIFKGSDCD